MTDSGGEVSLFSESRPLYFTISHSGMFSPQYVQYVPRFSTPYYGNNNVVKGRHNLVNGRQHPKLDYGATRNLRLPERRARQATDLQRLRLKHLT